jgi:hypothetical protein
MGWYIYCFFMGWVIAKADWSGMFSGAPVDCTHAWQNNHCYVCGDDR